jgi:hypothetical protein
VVGCELVISLWKYIYIFATDGFSYIKVLMSSFGGPQALPGGAQPDPQGVYPPKGFRVYKVSMILTPKVMFNYLIIEV